MDRSFLKDKKRIVVKIGTTTITHVDTGHLNLIKMEKLARVLTDIRNQIRKSSLCPPVQSVRGEKRWVCSTDPAALRKSRPARRWDRQGL